MMGWLEATEIEESGRTNPLLFRERQYQTRMVQHLQIIQRDMGRQRLLLEHLEFF